MVEGLHLTSMETAQPPELTIGEVAALTGLPVKRIHYYERRGLLEPPPRNEAGYRLYGAEEVARLEFVMRAKLLGLTLEEIRELVSLAVGCNEGEIVPRLEELLDAKLEETERKIAELSAFRENLIYYRRRAEELREGIPVESTCEEASFCGCLDVVTGEGGEHEDER
jgi:MerR family copper efflux transcriptional regulator